MACQNAKNYRATVLPAPNGDDPRPEEALEEEDARSAVKAMEAAAAAIPEVTMAEDEDAPRPDSADPELRE